MKKICAVILCLCILLSGCNNKENDKADQASKDNTKITDIAGKEDNSKASNSNQGNTDSSNVITDTNSKSDQEDTGTKLLTLSKEWALMQNFEAITPDYQAPSYEAKVAGYKIAKDLSNVENIDLFSGFSKEQKNMLVKNGFVVLPGGEARVFNVYEDNEYRGVPNFVTTDSVLHIYHQFYDKSLMNVEAGKLYDDLDLMTKQMLDKSILLFQELKDEKLKALQEKNIVYYLVARMVFLQKEDTGVQADQELLNLAKQEYELIQSAEGYTRSPLFQFDFDYSQFKIRGHYTRSEKLGRFFQTMMWFGTAPFSLKDKEGNLNYDNIAQSLLIAYTTFADSQATCDAKLWTQIYEPTSEYVGLSDDINVFQMNGLRLTVYGENSDPNTFLDTSYHTKLAEAVNALPEPKISANLITLSTPTGKQFRFMGQRYILDSDILQKLIDPVKRPIPTSLDVMGVLGSKTAEKLLLNVYKPQEQWPKYTENYNNLKKTVAGYDTGYWKTNLYSGWLWSLQDVLTEYDSLSGMPFFMTTDAWKYKSLNTALGSYTELKHDSVLYGKQPVAEMGGPVEFAKQHYVEPNVALYSKLLYLTDTTASVLQQEGTLSDKIMQGVKDYKEFLQLLIDCSIKELKNEPLTEKENESLLRCGGTMENIMMNFLFSNLSEEDSYTKDVTDMLVSDIATCKDTYLQLGTGYFDEMYVVFPYDGKLYLSRGSVYSFYEFTSDTRLTDEEWWALQGINYTDSDFGGYYQFGDVSSQLPEQPSWTDNFKKGSNRVIIKTLEVDWDDLEE